MYVAEFRDLHARRRRQRPARPDQPHHALREHEGRRRLRQAHRVRRQAGAAAHDRRRSTTTASSPTRPHSDDIIKYTDTNNDGVADKQRDVLYRRRPRPRRQPRARAGRLHLGPRQLDLHHLQRLPLPLDAGRASCRSRPAERRPVGRDAWTTTARCGSSTPAASAAR